MTAKRATKKRHSAKGTRTARRPGLADDDFALSTAQRRELEKRIRYLEDRTRFLVVSALGPHMLLYYDVVGDSYVMKDPRGGTLFKRRAIAAAVMRCLGKSVELRECKVDRAGRLIVSSVAKTASSPPKARS